MGTDWKMGMDMLDPVGTDCKTLCILWGPTWLQDRLQYVTPTLTIMLFCLFKHKISNILSLCLIFP